MHGSVRNVVEYRLLHFLYEDSLPTHLRDGNGGLDVAARLDDDELNTYSTELGEDRSDSFGLKQCERRSAGRQAKDVAHGQRPIGDL
jgi:hypothetical protein